MRPIREVRRKWSNCSTREVTKKFPLQPTQLSNFKFCLGLKTWVFTNPCICTLACVKRRDWIAYRISRYSELEWKRRIRNVVIKRAFKCNFVCLWSVFNTHSHPFAFECVIELPTNQKHQQFCQQILCTPFFMHFIVMW